MTAATHTTPIQETVDDGVGVPDAVVAVYASEEDLTRAVKHLEHERYDMSSISVLGRGMSEERHVIGFDPPERRTPISSMVSFDDRDASWIGLSNGVSSSVTGIRSGGG